MTEPTERTTSVFAVADRSFTVDDVIGAAFFRGDLDQWWKRAQFLDECETRSADDLGEPDDEASQSASEQFRYERDLITAEETEAWLEARGLTADDFSDHFLRHYWAEQLSGEEAPTEEIDYLSAPEELRELLRVELLLSGGLDKLALALAWRFAALRHDAARITPELIGAQRTLFFERTRLDSDGCAEWLARLRRDESWLDEMLALEAAYRLESAAVLTTLQCERMLHAQRMPLTRVQVETIELDCGDAAHEAVLCVREDGATMAEVAAEGRYPYRSEEILLDDIPSELQQKFLCAVPGDLLGPIARGDGFQLCRLARKIEPALDDSRIRARVEREILTRHFTELAAGYVRWQPGFSPP